MKEYAYINGKILPIEEASVHITDLGLLRGYGIFDFFRAIDGVPIFMDDHLARFDNSVRFLDMELPVSKEHLKDNILELIKLNPHPLLGIRLVCTGGLFARRLHARHAQRFHAGQAVQIG